MKNKYGPVALVAGASEGLGAAFSRFLAGQGMDLVLIARRAEPLEKLAGELRQTFSVSVDCISCDLAGTNATEEILQELKGKEINLLVYNAAISYIRPFEKNTAEQNLNLARANMITPMNLVLALGKSMLKNKKGAVVLMASLAGFQGSGYLAAYASSKAFNRVLAESLWYEWKDRGVDVIACCAGATLTPNFVESKPEKTSFFAPRIQKPEEVVQECMDQLGKKPSFIPGFGNRLASFMMQKLFPRKMAINIMGDTTRKMYRL